MSCSILDKVKSDLRSKNLVNSSLEAPFSKEKEVTKYVLDLTSVAKKNYKVDMGNIFTIRKLPNNLKLEPNIPALEAIERSKEYEVKQIQKDSQKAILSRTKEGVEDTYFEAPQLAVAQPTILAPKGLPEIKINC